ncbi:MAG: hypothetical protein FWF63_10970 [Fibromonadales bacterium]|nr:hypothetical protein [Fibromonadales bacterium]
MPLVLFIFLFFTLAVYGQEQKRVAILNTVGEGDLIYLSVRLREIAVKVLPEEKYSIMTAESIIDKLGSKENANKVCREAQCLAKIGQKVSAAYVGQARVGSFGDKLTIFMELYNSASSTLVSSFTGEAKDLSGLLAVIDEKAPEMFRKIPGASSGSKAPPISATPITPTSFKDSRDNKIYKIVKIGTQIWMAENLNFNTKDSKCYDNKPANCEKYGRLYNWETARKICPKGWHLPNYAELAQLMEFIGDSAGTHEERSEMLESKEESGVFYETSTLRLDFSGDYPTAGTKLKAKRDWLFSIGKDIYGFSALPGGGYVDSKFYDKVGVWWLDGICHRVESKGKKTEIESVVCYMYMKDDTENVISGPTIFKTNSLLSVRCVQD